MTSINRAPVAHTTGLMEELTELWCEERCGIDWRFEECSDAPWTLLLTWVQEYSNLHGANWTEYTWEFYGRNLEEAITEAIEWCRGLLPFEECHACDGRLARPTGAGRKGTEQI